MKIPRRNELMASYDVAKRSGNFANAEPVLPRAKLLPGIMVFATTPNYRSVPPFRQTPACFPSAVYVTINYLSNGPHRGPLLVQ
jgi:hypothetical protein